MQPHIGDAHFTQVWLAVAFARRSRPEPSCPPSAEVLAKVRRRIAEAIERGSDAERKVPAQALIARVSVSGRDHIEPFFRVPSQTRPRFALWNV
jgi:hypothetical protein